MQREKFGSRLGFILISAGCAIGLGNVWRFPYITGKYGGAAFVLIYLVFLVLLGLPIMVMEFAVGRASQASVAMSFDRLEPLGTKWHWYKWFGMAGNYLLMMFYTTIGGWILLYVFKMAGGEFEGKNADEIVSYIEQIKPKVRASFVVDTLVYLYRGGRCSGLAAMAGGVLKLHPRIGVAQGKMSPGKKYRGKISKVVMDYVKDMEADLMAAKKDRVFITHSGCDKEIVDNVKEYLKSLNRFDEIIETRAGGVISSHCGPGTLGVLFIDGKN